MSKVLALTKDGRLTYCTALPENRGIGRCDHVEHQKDGETIQEFFDRAVYEKKSLKQISFTEEEKKNMVEVKSRNQLTDEELPDGGYIDCPIPLWTPININEFHKLSKIPKTQIEALLGKNKILDEENMKIIDGKKGKTGVDALNELASFYGYTASESIYVIPSYMRGGDMEDDQQDSITGLYKQFLRGLSTKSHDDLQRDLDRILMNDKGQNKLSGREINQFKMNGFPVRSMFGVINGKKGLMRKYITGTSVPYTARCVSEPDIDCPYGTVEIPYNIAAEIFKPQISEYLYDKGVEPKQIKKFLQKFDKKNQNDINAYDLVRLDNIMQNCNSTALVSRAPHLHNASIIAMKMRVCGAKEIINEAKYGTGETGFKIFGKGYDKKISKSMYDKNSGGVSVGEMEERLKKMNFKQTEIPNSAKSSPLHAAGYNLDHDGDQLAIMAINSKQIADLAMEEMSAYHPLIRNNPKYQEESLIGATKDAWYGLQSIFSAK